MSTTSVRASVGSRYRRGGEDVAHVGFVILGDKPVNVLVRAAGPALRPYLGGGFAEDPELISGNGFEIAKGTGDDWSAMAGKVTAAGAKSGAFPFPAGSKDAAVVKTVNPGALTVMVRNNGRVGECIVELYIIPD